MQINAFEVQKSQKMKIFFFFFFCMNKTASGKAMTKKSHDEVNQTAQKQQQEQPSPL